MWSWQERLPNSGSIRYHWLHRVGSGHTSCVAWNDLFLTIVKSFWRHGVTSSNPSVDPRAVDVAINDTELTVDLADGRRVAVPLAWFPRLLHAQQDQRENWQLVGDGEGIHWLDIDEDLSVNGLLQGVSAPGQSKRAV